MPILQVSEAATTSATVDDLVKPAVLEGTPENFPIGPDELISKAKAVFDTQTGLDDDSVLADDFRFEFPVVSLDKAAYLKAVRGFGLKDAIPNLNANPYHWRVDPYEPNRVWFTTRTTGTHTGTLKFAGKSYPATGNNIYGAPECLSYVFNEDGKVKSFTGGYVMDRRCGNTQGMGALFGILAAIGVNFPKPGTLGFAVFATINRFVTWMKKLFKIKDD